MVRIYFDVAAVQEALLVLASEATITMSTFLSIEYINVYECGAKYGTYSMLGSYSFNPHVDYINVQPVNDLDWFRLTYYDTTNGESVQSEPVIGDILAEIVDRVAKSLGDTNRETEEDAAFSDEEYIRKVKEAIKRFKNQDGVPTPLTEAEWGVIMLLIRSSCCYDLAYDTARYYRLELPDGTKLFKGEVTKHYLDLAKALEEQYQRILADWDDSLSGTPSFDVIQCTKKTYFDEIDLNDRSNLKARIYGT